MPPKGKCSAAPSKKTEMKKKEKVIEDKTFGLKNKKGAKQQKFIQQVEKQVKSGGAIKASKAEELRKAELEKKKNPGKDEFGLLIKPVATQKIEKGADPKSILCAFFKQGTCGKGDKCKFSHDLTIERKAEKRSLYCDMRDDGEGGDTMENWDEQKLSEVAETKHGEADLARQNQTDIICRFFLEAVEKSKYGWFWECPNGKTCIYRHALPPGFQLKKDKKKDANKDDEISLEDLIERERAALGSTKFTKVTLDSFLQWKKRKLREKAANAKQEEEKKRNDFRAGRQVGISGREMFVFNPELATQGEDGDEEGEAVDYSKLERCPEDEEDEIQYREIVLDDLALEAQEADGSGSQAKEDRLQAAAAQAKAEAEAKALTNGDTSGTDEAMAAAIDENLFLEEELDDLDDDLDDLNLSDPE